VRGGERLALLQLAERLADQIPAATLWPPNPSRAEPGRPSALLCAPSAPVDLEVYIASLRHGAGGERHKTDGERSDGELEL